MLLFLRFTVNMDSISRRNFLGGSYGPREKMPKQDRLYSLDEMLEVLFVDSAVRELLDFFEMEDVENVLYSMAIDETRNFFKNGQLRLVVRKISPAMFQFTGVFAVTPNNSRLICTSPFAQDEMGGRGFMGLGGNSFPRRI